ncbi:leucine-rich repeat neuronal protein 4 [Melanotaenia boesemani]|uniref:leucine-rich repeat neuronal protein 4 n=1 Tax=Melanotaenia boesemani TaxID=1250792 RepID=UPI001C0407AB|nr:leucine-rich repeat neuronal protein 4 [Melanotaenia boesemani]
MASLHRILAALLFFVLPLMRFHLFSHAASTSLPTTRQQIIFLTGLGFEHEYEDEYGDEYNGQTSLPEVPLSSVKTPLLHQERKFCQYNLCLENQEPCHSLAEKNNCLCPGMSGSDEPPHAPRIQALLPVSQGDNIGKIEVQWCAPASLVSSYRVMVEGKNSDTLEFGNNLRRGLVGFLEVGTKVCVEAVNNAGPSSPSEFSCKRYEHPESSDHKLLAWVIGGGIALFLFLVIAAVILWKHLQHQNAKRNSSDGLGNPSYKTEGIL